MKHTIRIVVLIVGLAHCLAGVSVKVTSINHESGEITVLLPMHQVEMKASLMPGERGIRVKQREFYEASFESGRPGRPKVLRITVPGEKPARFRLVQIKFLD